MPIDHRRIGKLLSGKQQDMLCHEAMRLGEAVKKLLDADIGSMPWDWRYNATHWALDVGDLCGEIGYSIASMRAFAECALDCEEPDSRTLVGRVSYYADNAATRISSCRDKLALLAWSYYCPFNPDVRAEVLNFQQVCERFASPIRFGLRLEGHESFLVELNKLIGKDFNRAMDYRHKKVHRMEPRVMLREPSASDQPSYMFSVLTEKDIRWFDEKLKKKYPNPYLCSRVRDGCFIDGVLFERREPKQLLWHFDAFDQFTYACWKGLCDAAAGSIDILLNSEPMLSKHKMSEEQ